MAQAERLPGTRFGAWRPARDENATIPLPGIVAVRYTEALAAAEGHYRLGELDKALMQLELAAGIAGTRALPHVLSAEILVEAGRTRDGLEAYRRALELDPGDKAAISGYRWLISRHDSAPLGLADEGASSRSRMPSSKPRDVGARPYRNTPWLGRRRALVILTPYLLFLTAAELAVTFISPLLVFPLQGSMVIVAAVHVALLERRASVDPRARYLAAFLMAMMLTPLIRIISLTLPLTQIEPPYRYLFAGIPMVIGAVLVARSVGLRSSWIGLTWRDTGWQIVAVEASVFLGFLEYFILQPAALGALPWSATGWLPALSVAVATGFPEELIFRGILQTTARPLIGSRWSIIYVSLVFAVLHIGYQSWVDLVFVLSVDLLYGWLVERTHSIVGVSIGHGIANAVLFFVAPNLIGP